MTRLFPFHPTAIKIGGDQRLKWLQSYVTNDMRNLTEHNWLETFATDLKGKGISHGCAFSNANDLYFLSLFPDQAERLLSFWERYMFIVDVTGQDVSRNFQWFFVASGDWEKLWSLLSDETTVDANELKDVNWLEINKEDAKVVALKSFALGPDYILLGVPVQFSTKLASCEFADEKETRALAAANHFPWFGIDFGSENLPQEVDRDISAISFKKGCYLGQETIARLDALGQVQKKLFSVDLDGSIVATAPQEIFAMDSLSGELVSAGTLSSAYQLPNQKSQIGWAMLKRKFFVTQTQLKLSGGAAVHLRSK